MAVKRRSMSGQRIMQSITILYGARPSQPSAEHHHQYIIAMFDTAAAICFVQRDGDGRGRSVSVLVQIHVKSLERNFQSVGDGFDDAQIGLMWNDAGEDRKSVV